MDKLVTFRADGRVLHYSPGKVYTEKLNPLLETLLRKGTILILIDPLTLDEPTPAPAPAPAPAPKPEPVAAKPIEKRYSPKPFEANKRTEKDNEESDEDKE